MTPKKQFLGAFDMEFRDFADKIGARYSIVNGDLVPLDTGEFIVSETFGTSTIYLNKLTKTCNLIPPSNSYIGRPYKLKYTDCITLVASWLDKNRGSTFGNIYNTISRKQWLRYYEVGMKYWYIDNGFKEVTSLEEGDCLVYKYLPNITNHVGIYIPDNKILHHIPQKLSSLDTIDSSLIIGNYRYAN